MAKKHLTRKQVIGLVVGLGTTTIIASGVLTYGAMVGHVQQLQTTTQTLTHQNTITQANVQELTVQATQDQQTVAQEQALLTTQNQTVVHLKAQVSADQTALATAQTRQATLTQEADTNAQEITTLTHQNQALTAQIAALTPNLNQATAQETALQKQVAQASATLQTIQAELTHARAESGALSTAITTTQKTIAQDTAQIKQNQTVATQDATTLAHLKASVAQTAAAIQTLQKALAGTIPATRKAAVVAQIAQDQHQLATLTNQAATLQKQLAQTQADVASLTKAKATDTQTLAGFQKTLAQAQAKVKTLSQDLTNQTAAVTQATQNLATAEQTLAHDQATLTTAQHNLAGATETLTQDNQAKLTATQTVAKLTAQQTALQKQLATIRQEIAQTVAGSRYQALQKTAQATATALQDVTKQLNQAQATINTLTPQIAQEQAAVNQLKATVQTATQQITQDTAQITALKNQIAASTPETIYQALQTKLTATQAQVQTLTNQIQTLTKTRETDAGQIQTLTGTQHTLNQEIATAQDTVTQDQQTLSQDQAKLTQAQAQVKTLTGQIQVLHEKISADTTAAQNLPLFFQAYADVYAAVFDTDPRTVYFFTTNSFGQPTRVLTGVNSKGNFVNDNESPNWYPIPAPGYPQNWTTDAKIPTVPGQGPNSGSQPINATTSNFYTVFRTLYNGYYAWDQIQNPTQTDWSGHYLNNAADQQTWTFTNWLYNHLQSSIFFNHRNTSVSENFPFDYLNGSDGLNPLFQTSNYELSPVANTPIEIGYLNYQNSQTVIRQIPESPAQTFALNPVKTFSGITQEVPFFQSYTNRPINGLFDYNLTKAPYLFQNYFFPNMFDPYAIAVTTPYTTAHKTTVVGEAGGTYQQPIQTIEWVKQNSPTPETSGPVYWNFGSGDTPDDAYTTNGYLAGDVAWQPNYYFNAINQVVTQKMTTVQLYTFADSPDYPAQYFHFNDVYSSSLITNLNHSTQNTQEMALSSPEFPDAVALGNDRQNAVNGGITAELMTEYMNYVLAYEYHAFAETNQVNKFVSFLEQTFDLPTTVTTDIADFFAQNRGANFFGNAWAFNHLDGGKTSGTTTPNPYAITPTMMFYAPATNSGTYFKGTHSYEPTTGGMLVMVNPILVCTSANPALGDMVFWNKKIMNLTQMFVFENDQANMAEEYYVGAKNTNTQDSTLNPYADWCDPFNRISPAFARLNTWAQKQQPVYLWNTPNQMLWNLDPTTA